LQKLIIICLHKGFLHQNHTNYQTLLSICVTAGYTPHIYTATLTKTTQIANFHITAACDELSNIQSFIEN